ncbi:pyridoxal phosphate-dependent aminotransferase [Williamwhitmania taraxaci]|uniref:Aminotransferase n=1 Tax=Williamwhitmania taraxaci TaxID=1640674 RepID=A0A1G6GHE1_9BACT|nr:aminotransferase class I/II-fold pyridoxal phosphate-dependent enzyme [Williamwhitmania taraxaci]SDB81442.1 Aspartate/methionine/tyrosine aminotransferase [Williamwhitmania taraxaci]
MEISLSQRLGEVKEYYFSRKLQEIEQLMRQGIEVINLGIGNPDMPPPAQMQMRLSEVNAQNNSHGYQGYRGIQSLRIAFSNWYNLHLGVELNADNEILPLSGSKEGIMHLSMALLNPSDRVLVPNPGYPTYSIATQLAGGIPVDYNLTESNDFEPDFDELELMDLSKVKLMWVNYPHMPSGAKGNLPLFEKLVQFAKKHHILICHDNPYSFIMNDNPLSILGVEGAKEVAVELNSLSKSHNMAGWRVGILAGRSDIINAVLRFKSNMDSGMPLAVQQAATAALAVGSEWYTSLNKEYAVRNVIATKIALALNCTPSPKCQGGIFLWARIPNWVYDVESFCDEVLKQTRVFITPGTVFGSNGERYIRISLCADKATLQIALQRIETFDIHR